MITTFNRKKVLLISFYFPPVFSPGSLRMGKFAKYLPEYGWEPRVLTADQKVNSARKMRLEIDESYVRKAHYFTLGEFLRVKRPGDTVSPVNGIPASSTKATLWQNLALKSLRLLRPAYEAPLINKLVFDPLGWYSSALKVGREIISRESIDVIFSTYNPTLPHLVASELSRYSGIPWVADFRDLWSHNPHFRKTQPFQRLEELWEKRTVKNCARIVTVSEPLAKDLEAFHTKNAAVIPNGFDQDDYIGEVPPTAKFTITYAGQIYKPVYDPEILLTALSELKKEGRVSSLDLEVRFYGNFLIEKPEQLLAKHGVEDLVKVCGFVPFDEAIRRQKESTVLLLLGWNDARSQGELTSKIFGYFGAGRPILAITYLGADLDQFIRESGTGIVAGSVSSVKEVLTRWLREFKERGKIISDYRPNKEMIVRYSRREETKRLAEVLDEVILKGKNAGQSKINAQQ